MQRVPRQASRHVQGSRTTPILMSSMKKNRLSSGHLVVNIHNTQLSNLWWMTDSVSKGFGLAMRKGSSWWCQRPTINPYNISVKFQSGPLLKIRINMEEYQRHIMPEPLWAFLSLIWYWRVVHWAVTVVSNKSEKFSLKWELPTYSHPHSSTPLIWRKEGGRQAALILM